MSLSNLMEFEKEETKKFKTPDNPLAQYAEREKMGYNQAKQDTISYLKSEIEELSTEYY